MNVWLITVGEPLPTDGDRPRLLRAGILAQRMARAGHQVLWWSSTVNHVQKSFRANTDTRLTAEPRLDIQLLHGRLYKKNLSLSRIRNHREIAERFRILAQKEKTPDVILCSFPTIELSRTAVIYANEKHVPIVLDVRDLWPDIFADVLPSFTRPLARLLFQGMTNETRRAFEGADAVVGISQSYLDWGLVRAARPKRDADRVFSFGYEPPEVSQADRLQASAKLGALKVDPKKIICWFIGAFGVTYDLSTVIRAARKLEAEGNDRVQFVFSGQGERYDRWVSEAAGLANVVFTGWIDKSLLAEMMSVSSIGLAAYAEGAPQSLPNKIAEYWCGGLPILSSLKGETAALLERHHCGLTYTAGDSESFTQNLKFLLDSPDLRSSLGRNAQALFESTYSAQKVYSAMTEYLERLSEKRA